MLQIHYHSSGSIADARRREAGFTLIELLVILVASFIEFALDL